ncbi:class F sortase [Natronosporangium hydrolyticum]|uniref:Class F sortase n=1 Tax=Natronosporangium hydrolyticum TaxID=2811111 RepID=A0A895Y7W3_9ACTN|nr:class F sortase [Natronosporangium hydrolyticum]QSB13814.1 class F sortase [Natronosporangium hydrolyticum]
MGRSPDAATVRTSGRHGSPWRAAGFLVVALLIVTGVSLVLDATGRNPLQPPQPPASGFGLGEDRPTDGLPDLTVPPELLAEVSGLPRSEPAAIKIPEIDVAALVMNVGIDEEGKVDTPPLEEADQVGWYQYGPSPGEVGSAVMVGHVDSHITGEAVFFELGALRPGDQVEVLRRDGHIATFTVDRVESFPKDAFPSEEVYAPSNQPQLRLITCGGAFDEELDDYPDNVIVFAS